jgi:hypothetical protein
MCAVQEYVGVLRVDDSLCPCVLACTLQWACIPHCRLTLADIFCVAALFYPIKVVLTEEQRAAFPATMRCVVATQQLQCQEGFGCVERVFGGGE